MVQPSQFDIITVGLLELEKKLARLDTLDIPLVHRLLESIGAYGEQRAKRHIEEQRAMDTRRLHASVTYHATVTAIEGVVFIGANAPEGPWVEYGREPGRMPPPRELIPWVRRHRMSGSYSIKSHRRIGGAYDQYWEDLEVAFAVARKIWHHGIKARPFMKPAAEDVEKQLPTFIRQAERAIKELWEHS
jgi:hypothetical protein